MESKRSENVSDVTLQDMAPKVSESEIPVQGVGKNPTNTSEGFTCNTTTTQLGQTANSLTLHTAETQDYVTTINECSLVSLPVTHAYTNTYIHADTHTLIHTFVHLQRTHTYTQFFI